MRFVSFYDVTSRSVGDGNLQQYFSSSRNCLTAGHPFMLARYSERHVRVRLAEAFQWLWHIQIRKALVQRSTYMACLDFPY